MTAKLELEQYSSVVSYCTGVTTECNKLWSFEHALFVAARMLCVKKGRSLVDRVNLSFRAISLKICVVDETALHQTTLQQS
jgi:hypothetical protein